jgi:hypothetical protein
MRALSHWIIALCASPAGVIVLAALDSTVFFSLPFGIDAAVIILAARMRELWWLVPLLATAGSVAGATLTFWMGVRSASRDSSAGCRASGRQRSAPGCARKAPSPRRARPDPPPFPFTPFVLAAGALDGPRTFFVTLTVCRVLASASSGARSSTATGSDQQVRPLSRCRDDVHRDRDRLTVLSLVRSSAPRG